MQPCSYRKDEATGENVFRYEGCREFDGSCNIASSRMAIYQP